MDSRAPLLIVGGGLAGSLAALALHRSRPDLPFLLVEGHDRLGGNHVWSYFDGDLDDEGHALLSPLGPRHWPAHRVEFAKRRRRLGFGYNSIRSSALDTHVRATLPASKLRLGSPVVQLSPTEVSFASGETIEARAVVDARGPAGPMEGLELAWQKFVGVEIEDDDHGLDVPIIMDGTVEQVDGYRFVYSLPFADDRVFIEDTYYSDTPDLDPDTIRNRLDDFAHDCGWEGEWLHEETGVLPVVMDGNPQQFWPGSDRVPRLGLTGGFFHPMTGYSLPFAVSNALALARLDDHSAPALAHWTRQRFLDHWREGSFYRALARMLFRGAPPEKRVRVFEHFYRLPEPVIARFYAHRLTTLDKVRILCGRPPVAVGKAIRALFS